MRYRIEYNKGTSGTYYTIYDKHNRKQVGKRYKTKLFAWLKMCRLR